MLILRFKLRNMTRILSFTFFTLSLFLEGFSQTVVWTDDFETPASWTLNVSSGLNDIDANSWFISDAEGGVAAGGCGTAGNGNKTLHVGCQGTWCAGTGAIYNAGDGGLGFIFATTNKRALYNANISTVGYTAVSLAFDFIGIGQSGADYASVLYSIDGGTSWNVLQVIPAGTTCPNGQGQWQTLTASLPIACLNINNLRLGFQWVNNNDGAGTDPSFAVNNVRLTIPSQMSSNFNTSNSTICQGECITFSDASTGGANSWLWDFGDGATSTDQNPVHCFNTPGNLTCQLTVSNGTSSNTSSQVITIDAAPGVGLSYQDGTVSALDNNAFYQWVLCPSMVAIPGATSQTYTPTINASYAVIVLNAAGCSDTSQCITVSDLSLNENNTSGPSVFPNPFTNAFELSGIPVNTAFRLMTTDGKVVMHGYSGLQPVECGQLSAGCYFLSVGDLSKERVIVLIKE